MEKRSTDRIGMGINRNINEFVKIKNEKLNLSRGFYKDFFRFSYIVRKGAYIS